MRFLFKIYSGYDGFRPADGWFEWQRTGHAKQPYFLALEDGSPLSFAALWEHWGKGNNSLESFTIITTMASPELAVNAGRKWHTQRVGDEP